MCESFPFNCRSYGCKRICSRLPNNISTSSSVSLNVILLQCTGSLCPWVILLLTWSQGSRLGYQLLLIVALWETQHANLIARDRGSVDVSSPWRSWKMLLWNKNSIYEIKDSVYKKIDLGHRVPAYQDPNFELWFIKNFETHFGKQAMALVGNRRPGLR